MVRMVKMGNINIHHFFNFNVFNFSKLFKEKIQVQQYPGTSKTYVCESCVTCKRA